MGSGPVWAMRRRSGVTASSTPAIAPTSRDHGPAAQMTQSVSIALRAPPRRSMVERARLDARDLRVRLDAQPVTPGG